MSDQLSVRLSSPLPSGALTASTVVGQGAAPGCPVQEWAEHTRAEAGAGDITVPTRRLVTPVPAAEAAASPCALCHLTSGPALVFGFLCLVTSPLLLAGLR